jgi:hypothetical protein
MKPGFSKRALLAAALLTAASAGPASAHTQRGALGKLPTAADIYEGQCTAEGGLDPNRAEVRIRGVTRRSFMLSITVEKDSISATSTDKKLGDRGFSPFEKNPSGGGSYRVTVTKTPMPGKPEKRLKKSEPYVFEFHCLTGSGGGVIEVGTNLNSIQNQ